MVGCVQFIPSSVAEEIQEFATFLLNLPKGEWELKAGSGTGWSLFPPEEGKEGMSPLGFSPELRVRGGKQ